jgi:hypothetical protein
MSGTTIILSILSFALQLIPILIVAAIVIYFNVRKKNPPTAKSSATSTVGYQKQTSVQTSANTSTISDKRKIPVGSGPVRATKFFDFDERGVPDSLGGTLYILDKFTDAVGRFGDKNYLPVNRLPANPEIVEATITDFLERVRDPDFRQTISSRCPDHHQILRSDYLKLLRFCLAHNLPRFIDEDEARYLNLILLPVRTDGQPTPPEEIEAHFDRLKKKLGLTSENIIHATDRQMETFEKGQEIERRLQSRGL